jgi:hypothetical protein
MEFQGCAEKISAMKPAKNVILEISAGYSFAYKKFSYGTTSIIIV